MVYREEVTAALFAITDISYKLDRIIALMEEDDGEEEEEDEDAS